MFWQLSIRLSLIQKSGINLVLHALIRDSPFQTLRQIGVVIFLYKEKNLLLFPLLAAELKLATFRAELD